jgi:hypothetical protein
MRRWNWGILLFLAGCNQLTPGPVDANAWIERVEWGQTVIGANLRLVPFKPTELLVYARADQAGLSPSLEARVYQNNILLGRLPLLGPDRLPLSGGDLTPEQAYRAQLPLNWVTAGLRVEVVLDPANQWVETNESDNFLQSTPQLGAATDLYLTLVPVTYLGQPPTIPDFEPKVYQRWPLRDLVYQTRVAYTFTGTLTSNNLSGWNALLSQLNALRALDQSQGRPGAYRYYYGFIKAPYDSGFAGIGYIGLPVAAGWDKAGSAEELMTHELGHNFGLAHAPCGGPANPDPNYPYAGASIGSWGIGLAQRQLKDPAVYKDVMSYCANPWVSDYHYHLAQNFLESRPPNPLSSSLVSNQLLISGWVDAAGLQLNPPIPFLGRPIPAEPGPYSLRLRGADGEAELVFATRTAVLEPQEEGRAALEVQQFMFSLPWKGSLKSAEVWRSGQRLLRRTSSAILQSAALNLGMVRSGDRLKLDWNIQVAPYLSLVYRQEGQVVPLALWMQGGQASVDLTGLPQGAELEVWASDGLQQWNPAK